ncbi:MAG: hypothetical protein GF403_06580 [Candidatus Coatesbacteria bacterium]|nr:hypothetical protein [Candidatus Coatesbacteria bacterium]
MKKAMLMLLSLLFCFAFAHVTPTAQAGVSPAEEEMLYEYEFLDQDEAVWPYVYRYDYPDLEACSRFKIEGDDALVKSFDIWTKYINGTGYIADWEVAVYEHIPGSPGHPADEPLFHVAVDHTWTESSYPGVYIIELILDDTDWFTASEDTIYWLHPLVTLNDPSTQSACWAAEGEYTHPYYYQRLQHSDDWVAQPFRAYMRVNGEWANTGVVETSWGEIKAYEND